MATTKETKSELVTLTIDGKSARVPKGTLVIEAARQVGVMVPHFCYQSNTDFLAAVTWSDLSDFTTIPSATGVLQEVCRRGIFSISTRHIRQLASGGSFGW